MLPWFKLLNNSILKLPSLGFGKILKLSLLSNLLELKIDVIGPFLELSAPIFINPFWKSTGLPK